MSENKTVQSQWKTAFLKLLPKAKHRDAAALTALRNHYSQAVLSAAEEITSDQGKRELSYKRSFAKAIQNCSDEITEEEFLSLLLDTVQSDLSTDAETDNVRDLSSSAKVDRKIRPIDEPKETAVIPSSESRREKEEPAKEDSTKTEKGFESAGPVKTEEDKHRDNKASAPPSEAESNGTGKNIRFAVIALLCAAVGICVGVSLTKQENGSPEAVADTRPTTGEISSSAVKSEEAENYDVWVVEPSLPFDGIMELYTDPPILPGIEAEVTGYPQNWHSDYEANAIRVGMNGSFGVYDYYGNNLLPVCMSWLESTPSPLGGLDLFAAEYQKKPYYISNDFKSIVPFVYGGIGASPEFFYAFQNGVFGIVSTEGKRKFSRADITKLDLPDRNAIMTVDENCIRIGWVVSDSSGRILSGPYQNKPSRDMFLYPYVNAMISVFDCDPETMYVREENRHIAFINPETGQQVTGYDFQETKCFQDGYAPVKKNGKWGFIDKNGKEVTDFIFDDASALYDGKAYVKINGYYGVIDIRKCDSDNIRVTEKMCETGPVTPASVPQDNPTISDGRIGTVAIKVDKLNIREWGSTNAKKVGQCNTGDTFDVYEITEDSKYTWYRIGENRWVADLNGRYLHYHETEADESSPAGFTDSELCEKAKNHYAAVHGQKPPIVKVEDQNGSEAVIHLYEVLDDHMATWDWYYIDRRTGKGRNILNESIDISSY